MPQVTDEECKKIDADLAKHAKEKKQIDALRAKMTAMRGQAGGGGGGGGGGGNPEMRAINDSLRTIYTSIGLDSRTAGACRRRAEGGGGQFGGGRGQVGGTQAANGTRSAQGNQGGLQPSPEFTPLRARPRAGLVFVAQGTTYRPKVVQLGQSNFDYTEVVSGLNEGDRVALLASLAIQAQRQQQNDRARQNANPLGANPGGGPGRGPGGPGGGGPGGGGGGGPRGGR
jgi:hypothetical protein